MMSVCRFTSSRHSGSDVILLVRSIDSSGTASKASSVPTPTAGKKLYDSLACPLTERIMMMVVSTTGNSNRMRLTDDWLLGMPCVCADVLDTIIAASAPTNSTRTAPRQRLRKTWAALTRSSISTSTGAASNAIRIIVGSINDNYTISGVPPGAGSGPAGLELDDLADAQPMLSGRAGWQLEYGLAPGTIRLRIGVGWQVGYDTGDALAVIEPYDINVELHILHPHAMLGAVLIGEQHAGACR